MTRASSTPAPRALVTKPLSFSINLFYAVRAERSRTDVTSKHTIPVAYPLLSTVCYGNPAGAGVDRGKSEGVDGGCSFLTGQPVKWVRW